MFQVLGVVAAEVFGRTLPPYQQALVQLLVLVGISAMNTGLRPVRYELVERMAFCSHCVLVATVAMGLMFERSLSALRKGDAVRPTNGVADKFCKHYNHR